MGYLIFLKENVNLKKLRCGDLLDDESEAMFLTEGNLHQVNGWKRKNGVCFPGMEKELRGSEGERTALRNSGKYLHEGRCVQS